MCVVELVGFETHLGRLQKTFESFTISSEAQKSIVENIIQVWIFFSRLFSAFILIDPAPQLVPYTGALLLKHLASSSQDFIFTVLRCVITVKQDPVPVEACLIKLLVFHMLLIASFELDSTSSCYTVLECFIYRSRARHRCAETRYRFHSSLTAIIILTHSLM